IEMGCYSRYIFPWLVDHVMDSPQLAEQRRLALAGAAGEVLEIGFGRGLNLPFYPPAVERVTAIDANAGMAPRAAGRMADARFEIEMLGADAAKLPLADGSFDTVV